MASYNGSQRMRFSAYSRSIRRPVNNSMIGNMRPLLRLPLCVIWRDNGAKASLVEPFTTLPPLGSPNPRDLWKWMATVEEKTGAEILALARCGADCFQLRSRSTHSR